MTCAPDNMSEGAALAEILAATPRGLKAVEEAARSLGVDLPASPAITFELVRHFRLARQAGAAIELIRALAERHPTDGPLIERCFNLLHRSGGYRDALELLDRSVRAGALRRYPPVAVVEADCLRALGMPEYAKAVLKGVDKSRVRGVTAQILARIESDLPASGDDSKLALSSGQRRAPIAALSASPESVFEQIRELRASRNLTAAADLTRTLAREHPDDPAVLGQCFQLLHRTGGYEDALALLETAARRKLLEESPAISVIRADCLLKLGRADEARTIVRPMKTNHVSGVTAQILTKLHQSLDIKPPAPEVLAIRSAFDQKQELKGATLFRALLQSCRAEAAVTVERTIRDNESETYQAAFAEAAGPRPPGRSLLIISDSIALPRPSIDVSLEQSYPWLAHKALLEATEGNIGVWPDCRRGRTAPEALRALKTVDGRCAGIALQVGIVDCAPRVFSEVDVHAVRKVLGPDAAEDLIELSRQHRRILEGSRKASVYVSREEFGKSVMDFVRLAKTKAELVALLTIVTPSRRGQKMSGTPLSENIIDYNSELRRTAAQEGVLLVDVDEAIWSRSDAGDCFTQDNYHYNAVGHAQCAQILTQALLSAGLSDVAGAAA